MANESPTLLRRRLAGELQRLRKEAGYTRDGAARTLDWSPSKLNRIENTRFKRLNPNDVGAMLDLYGVTDKADRDAMIDLARRAKQRGWWQQYSDVLPDWFEPYIGLEAEATQFQTYEALLVPGLLQTEDYARAVVEAASIDGSQDEVDRTIAVRMSRQKLLDERQRKFWIVLDESVLHGNIGGPEVMRQQLERLGEVSRQANVTLQVIPRQVGAYPGMHGPFVILGFPNPADGDVVYLDNETSSLYLEEPEEIERYSLVFNHMRAAALTLHDSRALIARVGKEASS